MTKKPTQDGQDAAPEQVNLAHRNHVGQGLRLAEAIAAEQHARPTVGALVPITQVCAKPWFEGAPTPAGWTDVSGEELAHALANPTYYMLRTVYVEEGSPGSGQQSGTTIAHRVNAIPEGMPEAEYWRQEAARSAARIVVLNRMLTEQRERCVVIPARRNPHSEDPRDKAHAAGWNACRDVMLGNSENEPQTQDDPDDLEKLVREYGNTPIVTVHRSRRVVMSDIRAEARRMFAQPQQREASVAQREAAKGDTDRTFQASQPASSTGREGELFYALQRLCTHEKRTHQQIADDWDRARALVTGPLGGTSGSLAGSEPPGTLTCGTCDGKGVVYKCVICGSGEARTGACGSSDPRALCNFNGVTNASNTPGSE